MGEERAIIIFHIVKRNISVDVEVPLDITANELVMSLNAAYQLSMNTADATNCYLKAENPIVLLRGNKTLEQLGIRSGSIVYFTE